MSFHQGFNHPPDLVECHMNGRIGDLAVTFFLDIGWFAAAECNVTFKNAAVVGQLPVKNLTVKI